MDHTLGVFNAEMSMPSGFQRTREELARGCNLLPEPDDDFEEKPLLLTMMERIRSGVVKSLAPASGKKGQSPGTDMSGNSPGMMHSHYVEEEKHQSHQ